MCKNTTCTHSLSLSSLALHFLETLRLAPHKRESIVAETLLPWRAKGEQLLLKQNASKNFKNIFCFSEKGIFFYATNDACVRKRRNI